MKQNIFVLLIAILILTGCVVKNGHDNAVTSESLTEYAESKLCSSLVLPAYELAAYLFIDEYQVADEAAKAELMEKYNASGKIRLKADDIFFGPVIDEVYTLGLPLSSNKWGSGWNLSSDGKTWTRSDGISIEPIYDENGFLAEMAVSFDGIVDKHNAMQTRLYTQNGVFIMSNPLCVESVDRLYETSAYGASISNTGVRFRGTIRIDIFTDHETIDWIALTATNSNALDSETSRD